MNFFLYLYAHQDAHPGQMTALLGQTVETGAVVRSVAQMQKGASLPPLHLMKTSPSEFHVALERPLQITGILNM